MGLFTIGGTHGAEPLDPAAGGEGLLLRALEAQFPGPNRVSVIRKIQQKSITDVV